MDTELEQERKTRKVRDGKEETLPISATLQKEPNQSKKVPSSLRCG